MAAIPAQMSSKDARTQPPLPFSEVAPEFRCREPRSSAARFFLSPEISQPVIPPHAQPRRQARKATKSQPSPLLKLKLPALQSTWPTVEPAPMTFPAFEQLPIQSDSPPPLAQPPALFPDSPHPQSQCSASAPCRAA